MPSASTPAERPPTLLESALRREPMSAVVLLVMRPRVLLDLDRCDGARHVRADDGRECLDDDVALGCPASAAAVGDVDRHDDRHDAAVRVTADPAVWRRRPPLGTTNRDPSDLRTRRRVPPRLGRVQSWRDRASARTGIAAARLADDGAGEFPGQCDPAARRRRVSVDAAEACMSASVPVAHWLPDGAMAQWIRPVRFAWVSSTGPSVSAVAGC